VLLILILAKRELGRRKKSENEGKKNRWCFVTLQLSYAYFIIVFFIAFVFVLGG